MILHPKIVLTPSCQHCGAAGPDTSRSQVIWVRRGKLEYRATISTAWTSKSRIEGRSSEAGPCNLGIGSASKFIVVAC